MIRSQKLINVALAIILCLSQVTAVQASQAQPQPAKSNLNLIYAGVSAAVAGIGLGGLYCFQKVKKPKLERESRFAQKAIARFVPLRAFADEYLVKCDVSSHYNKNHVEKSLSIAAAARNGETQSESASSSSTSASSTSADNKQSGETKINAEGKDFETEYTKEFDDNFKESIGSISKLYSIMNSVYSSRGDALGNVSTSVVQSAPNDRDEAVDKFKTKVTSFAKSKNALLEKKKKQLKSNTILSYVAGVGGAGALTLAAWLAIKKK